jgi:hypothetical protein
MPWVTTKPKARTEEAALNQFEALGTFAFQTRKSGGLPVLLSNANLIGVPPFFGGRDLTETAPNVLNRWTKTNRVSNATSPTAAWTLHTKDLAN